MYFWFQVDQTVAAFCQFGDGDAAALADELGHGLQLGLRDEDELAAVVDDARELALLLQSRHSVNDVLRFHSEVGGEIFKNDNLRSLKRFPVVKRFKTSILLSYLNVVDELFESALLVCDIFLLTALFFYGEGFLHL